MSLVSTSLARSPWWRSSRDRNAASGQEGAEERGTGPPSDRPRHAGTILERDPHDVDPDDIVNIGIVRTIMGGRTTHEA